MTDEIDDKLVEAIWREAWRKYVENDVLVQMDPVVRSIGGAAIRLAFSAGRGEWRPPERMDPDVEEVRAILHAYQRSLTPPDSGWGNMSYLKGSYDDTKGFQEALSALRAIKAVRAQMEGGQ